MCAETSVLVTKGLQSQALTQTGNELPAIVPVCRVSDRPWNPPSPLIDWTIHELVRTGDNPEKMAAVFGEVIAKHEAYYQIFIDGLPKDDIVGSGVVHDTASSSYRLPNQCSVFSAFAIWKGLETIPQDDRRIFVLSDSLSILAAIENRKTSLDSKD